MRTLLAAQPHRAVYLQIYLWIRDTSLCRTASWVWWCTLYKITLYYSQGHSTPLQCSSFPHTKTSDRQTAECTYFQYVCTVCTCKDIQPRVSLPSEVEVVSSVVGEHPVHVSCSNDPNDVRHAHLVHQTRRHHQEEEVTHQHSSKQSAHTPAGEGEREREESKGTSTTWGCVHFTEVF